MRGLSVRDLTVRRGGATLLEGIALDVAPGELLAVVGPNGAGKTTLIQALAGWIRPDVGEVRVGDRPVTSLPGRARAEAIAWLPQRGAVREAVPAIDVVMAARFRFDEPRAACVAAARAALEEAGVAHLAHRAMTSLSGGESQRVGLAALLAQDAAILLLDEPANHLDPAVQGALYAFLGRRWEEGRTVVVVTHDPDLLYRVAPPDRAEGIRVLGLSSGHPAFLARLGEPGFLADLGDLFGLRAHRIEVGGRPRLLLGDPT